MPWLWRRLQRRAPARQRIDACPAGSYSGHGCDEQSGTLVSTPSDETVMFEPNQIEREPHVRHPDRMPSASVPLEQHSVAWEVVAMGQP